LGPNNIPHIQDGSLPWNDDTARGMLQNAVGTKLASWVNSAPKKELKSSRMSKSLL
jgi:hypothetical protein